MRRRASRVAIPHRSLRRRRRSSKLSRAKKRNGRKTAFIKLSAQTCIPFSRSVFHPADSLSRSTKPSRFLLFLFLSLSHPGLLPVHNFWLPLLRWNEVGMCKIVPRYALHHRVALLYIRFIFFSCFLLSPLSSHLSPYSTLHVRWFLLFFFLSFFLFFPQFFSLSIIFFYPSSWFPYIFFFFKFSFPHLLFCFFIILFFFYHFLYHFSSAFLSFAFSLLILHLFYFLSYCTFLTFLYKFIFCLFSYIPSYIFWHEWRHVLIWLYETWEVPLCSEFSLFHVHGNHCRRRPSEVSISPRSWMMTNMRWAYIASSPLPSPLLCE